MIVSLFEAKAFHLGANLLELSHSSENLVRIAYIRCPSHIKVQLYV